EESLTATVQAGVFGPELEERLQSRGFTLGHYPQSFEFSTVGGWVATRSAGQQSTGYGRIDENVHGLRCSTPSGPIELPTTPATAAGPNPRQLFVGSEGTLGIITEATVRIRRVPKAVRADSWFFPDFAPGHGGMAEVEEAGMQLAIAPLAHGNGSALGAPQLRSGLAGKGRSTYLGARGIKAPCLLVVRYDGSAAEVRAR